MVSNVYIYAPELVHVSLIVNQTNGFIFWLLLPDYFTQSPKNLSLKNLIIIIIIII